MKGPSKQKTNESELWILPFSKAAKHSSSGARNENNKSFHQHDEVS